jgi:hypothetical protein
MSGLMKLTDGRKFSKKKGLLKTGSPFGIVRLKTIA